MHPSKQSLLVVFFRIKWDLKEVAREIALIYEATLAEFDNEPLKVFNLQVGIVNWKTQIWSDWVLTLREDSPKVASNTARLPFGFFGAVMRGLV